MSNLKCRDCDHLQIIKVYEWSVDCKCALSGCETEMQDEVCSNFTDVEKKNERVVEKIERKDW